MVRGRITLSGIARSRSARRLSLGGPATIGTARLFGLESTVLARA